MDGERERNRKALVEERRCLEAELVVCGYYDVCVCVCVCVCVFMLFSVRLCVGGWVCVGGEHTCMCVRVLVKACLNELRYYMALW